MKFGSAKNIDKIDLSLSDDNPETSRVISEKGSASGTPQVYVGCAKWNSKDLKNFYPRGTKDELEYYGSQFNAIELNATFYNIYKPGQIEEWRDKVPAGFKFFPKVYQYISHRKWLSDIEDQTDDFIDSIGHFKDNLGTTFLQLRDNFRPKFFDRVAGFVEHWPEGIPLALELRHSDWFNDAEAASDLYALLEEHNVANVITDTAGRRDLLHMRLTNNEAFIRYVGANDATDINRLDDWVERLKKWHDEGLQNIHFFLHQNKEKKSPALAAHFIKNLNEAIDTELKIPAINDQQGALF